ncbi:tRNA-binding protein [Variovorax paradoxus]|uniref:tRNA-binding protein n=1 Tax=Variovorax paradoxus TaxID=34073 RepID=UPI0021601831|nr:tRNA-binding protein [Variovorax paradoxus]UVH55148.1 tRNA-binding protein [Variovorax paradoxus]
MTDIDPNAFERLELRVGRIVEAALNTKARVPAYKLKIDFGDIGTRTSSGQYTELYTPEDLVGRQVVCAMNLGSIRIGGFESQVLVVGARSDSGAPVLLTTERPVAPGATIF